MNERKIKYAFDRILKEGKVRKCLMANIDCSNKVIDAHSIQNSAILKKLAEDGHLYTLKPNVDATGVKLNYTGRNVASTFSGYCSFHDTHVFKEIDCKRFNSSIC